MPAQYEAIKRALILKGLSDKAAKGSAARIYNAQRPRGAAPVTGPHHEKGRPRAS